MADDTQTTARLNIGTLAAGDPEIPLEPVVPPEPAPQEVPDTPPQQSPEPVPQEVPAPMPEPEIEPGDWPSEGSAALL